MSLKERVLWAVLDQRYKPDYPDDYIVPEGVAPLEVRPTLVHKARSKASSIAPEDPSILGLGPTDAHRSMNHSFGLAPAADRIVGPTSGMFWKSQY
jgi:hypothetical protein